MSFFGAGEGPLQVPLEGVGAPAAQTLSPASHDFGTVAAGATGPLQVFQLRNEGSDPYVVDSTGLGGPDLGEFSIRSDGCTEAALAPGEACAVAVRFDPDSPGPKAAILRLRSAGGPIVARLSGTATSAAAVEVAPASPPALPTAGRVVPRLRSAARAGDDGRFPVGSARCESAEPCVLDLRTTAGGRVAASTTGHPARPDRHRSRITIAAGHTARLTLATPTERAGTAVEKLTVVLRWRTGDVKGETTQRVDVSR